LLYKNIKINIYGTIILPLVLCGSETLSLTLRQELRLRVFGNRVYRRRMHTGFWCGNLRERPFGRPKCIWGDNIKMVLQEMRWGAMDWIDLTQNGVRWQALVNAGMNLWVP